MPIKILVVDDSAFMRKMLTDIIGQQCDMQVVGQARDGCDALAKMAALEPDVITLDIEMPVLNGYETLQRILQERPTPVVMLSSITQEGADATVRCLELGAVDFIGKPSGSISLDIQRISSEIVAKIRAAATARIGLGRHPTVTRRTEQQLIGQSHLISCVVIGASTGGPRALQQLVPMLPVTLKAPIVIVQHMPKGFTASLADRLERMSDFSVREAADGDELRSGQILIAPGGRHLTFDVHHRVVITDDPPVHGVRPSVDVTMTSLLRIFGKRLLSVLLTGMGRDGARAMKGVVDAGGIAIAEDESTCVVFGMPKAAIDIGGTTHVYPLHEIGRTIASICRPADAFR